MIEYFSIKNIKLKYLSKNKKNRYITLKFNIWIFGNLYFYKNKFIETSLFTNLSVYSVLI